MDEIAKYGDMINEIKEVLQSARQNVAQQVNTELLTTYWNIGRIIVEHEQQSRERAEYGQQTLKELSKVLTKEFGKGFSRSNLQNISSRRSRSMRLSCKRMSYSMLSQIISR